MPRRFTRASAQHFSFNPADFDIVGDFTTLLWVRWMTFSGTNPQYVMSGGAFADMNSWNIFMGAPGASNDWRAYIYDASATGVSMDDGSLGSASDDEAIWTPIVIRRTGDASSMFIASIGNEYEGSFTNGAAFTLANLYLGTRADFDADRRFDGELAHLAHFTTALSDAAVAELLAGVNPQDVRDDYSAALQRYFPLNEASGNAVDLISGTVVGTDVNAVGAGLGTDPVAAYTGGGSGGTVDHFEVLAAGGGALSDFNVGTSKDVLLRAVDVSNEVVTSFTGTVEISGVGAVLSSGGGTSSAFVAGLRTATLTFNQLGATVTVEVEDSATGLITGTSATFAVVVAAAAGSRIGGASLLIN